MMTGARKAWLGAVLLLGACSPPKQDVLNRCQVTAQSEAKGRGLISLDVAELVEACMLSKGFALSEIGARCPENMQGATDRRCYAPNTAIGRFYGKIFAK